MASEMTKRTPYPNSTYCRWVTKCLYTADQTYGASCSALLEVNDPYRDLLILVSRPPIELDQSSWPDCYTATIISVGFLLAVRCLLNQARASCATFSNVLGSSYR